MNRNFLNYWRTFELGKISRNYYSTISITAANQICKAGIQFAVTIFLARVLTPDIFGAFYLALVYVIFAEMFRDFGISLVEMQRRHFTKQDFDRVFLVLSVRGFLISFLMIITAFLMGFSGLAFYTDKFQPSFLIMAMIPILSGISGVYNIELSRKNRFITLAWTDLCAFLFSLVTIPISLKLHLYSFVLPLQLLSYNILLAVFRVSVVRLTPYLHLDNFNFNTIIKQPMHFGVPNVFKALSTNIDTILIGNFLGIQTLGIYNRAYQMTYVPIQQLLESQSSFVVNRSRELEPYKVILNIHKRISPFLFLIYCFTIFHSHEIILVLYGKGWEQVSIPLQILAFAGIISSIEYKYYWLLITSESSKLIFRLGIFKNILTIGIVLMGFTFGLNGVCFSLVLSCFIGLISEIYLLSRNSILKIDGILMGDIVNVGIAFTLVWIFSFLITGSYLHVGEILLIQFLSICLLFLGIKLCVSYVWFSMNKDNAKS